MVTPRPLLVGALALGALLAGSTGALASGHAPDPAPGRVLERTLPGPAALRTLGAQGLQRAAAANEVAASRLAELLEDRTTRLTPDGRLYYADVPAADGTGDTTGADTPVAAEAPLDQTFALHSRPGSTRTIFLDFDGATVSGTWWNDRDGGGLPSTDVAAFSLDGDRATFDDEERRRIQDVWARVAEDYAPFDVDVTTATPAPGALSRSSGSDLIYGTHVLVAPGSGVAAKLCGGECAGIAWMDVFDRAGSNPGPAWVFADLTSRSGFQLAEVASHEAGHTLSLEHDGTTSSSYYTGRSPWGPIMGSSRYALTQFSNGDYAGADQRQDDLAAIAASGAPALADDHGDTPATTTSSLGASATGTAGGIVGDRHDQDVLRYDHGACPVTVTVSTAETGPNLDARLRVLDSSGGVLASANPPVSQPSSGTVTGTGAVLTLPGRPAGSLYVEVDGTGQGDMPTTGYSDYGSVGRYTVSVSGCAGEVTPDPADPGGSTGQEVQSPPGQARIGQAYSGAQGGTVTARATWLPPLTTGGSPLTGYRVTAVKVSADGAVLRRTSWLRPADSLSFAPRLTRGYHRFRVVALNAAGPGQASALSNRVTAR